MPMRTSPARTVNLRRVAALGAIAVVSFGLAACGDDDQAGTDEGSATEISDGITPDAEFCNDLRILIDAAADGETLDPDTATRDEVNAVNQEVGGALTELGISAQEQSIVARPGRGLLRADLRAGPVRRPDPRGDRGVPGRARGHGGRRRGRRARVLLRARAGSPAPRARR